MEIWLWVVAIFVAWLIGGIQGMSVMRNRNAKVGTHSASHNSRRNAISKKDAEYAHSMHRLEDEQDALDERDFGEAYDFHMDCGDR